MTSNQTELAKYGLGVAIGLLMMGFAFETFHWTGYVKANPAIGTISTTPGFTVFYVGVFVIGTVITYTSFVSGLASALTTPNSDSE